MVLIASGSMLAFLITYFLLPFIIRVAKLNNLYDMPDERKTHHHLVSSLGGVGIFAGMAISLLLFSDFTDSNGAFQYYLAAFFIVFILGVIDDIFVLQAWKKVVGQFFIASILTFKTGLLINNMQGFAGVYHLNEYANYAISFFVILLVINSFNLIDGVDGLAASLGLISCVGFGLFFLINSNFLYAGLGFSMAGALLAFLIYNFPPARIFMGDSGSMIIGIVNAVLLLKFIQTGTTVKNFPVHSAPAIGFALLLIPLMDVLRVFILRIAKGESPFNPDRNHIHHLLLNKGLSHTKVTLTLMIANFLVVFAAIIFQNLNINLLFAIFAALFFVQVIICKLFTPLPRKKHMHIVKHNLSIADNQGVKVLPIFGASDNLVINDE